MKIEVLRICAIGCNKRFMTIKLGDEESTLFIPEEVYIKLHLLGVPTAQKLRYQKDGVKK